MRVLLYRKNRSLLSRSGIGRAMQMQENTLKDQGIEVVTNPKEEYDVVHLNSVFPSDYCMARRARRAGKKVVYHAHSTEEDFRCSFIGSSLLAPLFRKWLICCYGQGDVILTPTVYAKSLLLKYGIQKPIYVISNGVDTFQFQKNEAARKRFRKAYGFSEKEKVILSVGLYFERKGIQDFVELAKSLPQYRFIWFGFTPDYQIPRRIRKAVHTHLPNLTFAGYVSPDRLRDAYSGCDLFFFPSYEETEGIVVLEALSSEIPVLLRDIPVYRDWLKNRTDVYKGKTQAEFQSLIVRILQGRLPDLTANGFRKAMERDLRKQAKKLGRIYSYISTRTCTFVERKGLY